MKRVLWLVPAILLLSLTAKAQDTPQWEVSGGYSYLDANLSGPGSSFHLNGGYGSADENLNSWLGGRFEFNAWGGSVSGQNVSAQTFTYGPVFSFRKFDKITPYAHAQFGAIHAGTGYLGISNSAFKLAIAPGGGVDFRINDHIGVRGQADYLMTRFLGLRQDNLQFSGGVVFYIGHK